MFQDDAPCAPLHPGSTIPNAACWRDSRPAWSVLAGGCATTAPVAPDTIEEVSAAPAPEAPEYIPVVRYGRYTLVELAPTAAQRDLLLQTIDVAMPEDARATVGDGLRHVLKRSGYGLCQTARAVIELYALPLPAAHLHLGPMTLRDALLTLAGPAWELHADDRARQSASSGLATAWPPTTHPHRPPPRRCRRSRWRPRYREASHERPATRPAFNRRRGGAEPDVALAVRPQCLRGPRLPGHERPGRPGAPRFPPATPRSAGDGPGRDRRGHPAASGRRHGGRPQRHPSILEARAAQVEKTSFRCCYPAMRSARGTCRPSRATPRCSRPATRPAAWRFPDRSRSHEAIDHPSALLLASTQWPAWAQQPATAPARNAQARSARLSPAFWTTGWRATGACNRRSGRATAN